MCENETGYVRSLTPQFDDVLVCANYRSSPRTKDSYSSAYPGLRGLQLHPIWGGRLSRRVIEEVRETMPPHCLGGRSSRAATAAPPARLWRVSAVLFLGCVGQRGNNLHAFAFAPPSSAHPSPSASSSSTSSSATLSQNRGGLAGAASSSSVHRLASRGVVRRQQGQQRCSSAVVARTRSLARSPGISPLRAGAGDDGYQGAGEDRTREEGNTGSEIRGDSGAVGEGAGKGEAEEPGLAMPDIVNPFKLAFEAGQNLRATLATTLEQITGTASPVSFTKAFASVAEGLGCCCGVPPIACFEPGWDAVWIQQNSSRRSCV